MKRRPAQGKVFAAALEVLRADLDDLRRRCEGCPHRKSRSIGFETSARGASLCAEAHEADRDEDEIEAVKESRRKLSGER